MHMYLIMLTCIFMCKHVCQFLAPSVLFDVSGVRCFFQLTDVIMKKKNASGGTSKLVGERVRDRNMEMWSWLHSAELNCAVSRCVSLSCAVLCCVVSCCLALCSAVLYCSVVLCCLVVSRVVSCLSLCLFVSSLHCVDCELFVVVVSIGHSARGNGTRFPFDMCCCVVCTFVAIFKVPRIRTHV